MGIILLILGIALIILYINNTFDGSDLVVILAWIFSFGGLSLLGMPENSTN